MTDSQLYFQLACSHDKDNMEALFGEQFIKVAFADPLVGLIEDADVHFANLVRRDPRVALMHENKEVRLAAINVLGNKAK